MPTGFVHSVKVPRLYKSSAKVVREVREKGGSLKSLIYQQKHPNVSALYSLCLNTLKKEAQLDDLLKKTNLLENEPRLDPWLAKILITELLWGKKVLNTDCKPAQTIRSYGKKLKEELNNISDAEALDNTPDKAVRKARYVRINTLLVPLEEGVSYFQDEGWSLVPKCSSYTDHLEAVKNLKQPNYIRDFHIPDLLVFPPDTTFHDHPGYQNGEILLQDKASCLPSQLLNPEPGSVVLDMCAAPGMKTTHLAAIMKNKGKIYAVEIDERRYTTLCEQVKVTGASCVETINKDALTLESRSYSDVNYILVDPTCSGSGMLDRQIVHGKEKCDPKRLKQLQAFQVFLLRHALLNFQNVKRVVYSTCSYNPEENEQVIDEILENVQNAYKLVPVRKLLKGDWLNFSSKQYKCSDKCLYAKSDVDLCNGFFVAVFERNTDVPLPEYKRKSNATHATTEEAEEMNDSKNEDTEIATRKRKKRGKRKRMDHPSKNLESEENGSNAPPEANEEAENDSSRAADKMAARGDAAHARQSEDEEPVVKKKKKKQHLNKTLDERATKEGLLSAFKENEKQKKKKRKTL